MENEQTYDDAFKELEAIMNAMQNDEITVDDLTIKVERATKLITYCSDKLRNTETKIKSVIDKLNI